MAYKFPSREPILSPVFCKSSLNMIFSQRGVGKTHTALGIAHAAASGSDFWGWNAEKPVKVLYIDGEMPGESLQDRLAEIIKSSCKEPPEGFLQFITIDLNDGMMPDISTLAGQIRIEEACLEAELIVIDNLSCLCRSGRENEGESWLSIGEWLMRMRSIGKCVILIHHAGKNGEQRGTSKREDILDISIVLKRPPDYNQEEGARFNVSFSKARHLVGNDAKPFEAKLQIDAGGKTVWATRPVEESTIDLVVELTNLGLKQSEIAIELGVDRSTVYRAYKKACEMGLIDKPKKSAKSAIKSDVDIDDFITKKCGDDLGTMIFEAEEREMKAKKAKKKHKASVSDEQL